MSKKPQIAAQISQEAKDKLEKKWPYAASTLIRALVFKYMNGEIKITIDDIHGGHTINK